MRAIWRGVIIADSDYFEEVNGTIYFPPNSIRKKNFIKGNKKTRFLNIGTASYYHIVVDGVKNQNAAWYFPDPEEKYLYIKNYIAFWQGVIIN